MSAYEENSELRRSVLGVESSALPPRGPRLRSVHAKAYSNTGLPGISFQCLPVRPGGRRYRFFYVRLGTGKTRKFNIDTLGKAEAFRRAVALRADYETRIQSTNAAILTDRQRSAAPIIKSN